MLGIIGGVGPRATATLYLKLIEQLSAAHRDAFPEIVIHSVAMTRRIENAFLRGQVRPGSEVLADTTAMLTDAVLRLASVGATLIVMPCNTLQSELRKICAMHSVDYLDMIDATIEATAAAGIRLPLILATTTTCRSDFYGARLRQSGLGYLYPDEAGQKLVEARIRHELDMQPGHEGYSLPHALCPAHCDGIVIGCTDLSRDMVAHLERPVFDSLDCLASAAARRLVAPDLGPQNTRPQPQAATRSRAAREC